MMMIMCPLNQIIYHRVQQSFFSNLLELFSLDFSCKTRINVAYCYKKQEPCSSTFKI